MYELCRKASNPVPSKDKKVRGGQRVVDVEMKGNECDVYSRRKWAQFSTTFDVFLSMKRHKMYLKLWIGAGRSGGRRIRGLAPESQRTRRRTQPCQANTATARPAALDQGEIGNALPYLICCNWLGELEVSLNGGRVAAVGLAKRKVCQIAKRAVANPRPRRHR